MVKTEIINSVKSLAVKSGILTAGSAVYIGMPCPCCGGTYCAAGIFSILTTAAAVSASGLLIKNLRLFKHKKLSSGNS